MGGRAVTLSGKVDLSAADRLFDWSGVHVVVAGLGTSGYAAADALLELDAKVLVLDDSDDDSHRDKGGLLEVLGAEVRLGPRSASVLPEETDLVVVSPGWRPTQPLVAHALAQGIPVWGCLLYTSDAADE